MLPQTMSGLVALGYLIASAPLLLAVLLADVSLHRITAHGERLVRESVGLVGLSEQVRDGLLDLERGARQYVVIQDQTLKHVVQSRLDRAQEQIDRIQRIELSAALRTPLAVIREGLDAVENTWSNAGSDTAAQRKVVDDIHALSLEARELVAVSHRAVESESERLSGAANDARTVVTTSLAALLPLTGLLALGVTLMVARPLKSARAHIAQLGRSKHDAPIAIGYPREMEDLGKDLDWLRRRLATLQADKDRFIRNVSHELKTPLASLKEGLDLLAEGRLGQISGKQGEVLEILGESAAELEQLISNLLTYARWKSERTSPALDWFECYPVVDDALKPYRLALQRKSLAVRLQLDTDRLWGDPVSLREALDNLISNAIKHAPSGTTIEIGSALTEDACKLTVRDFGTGVSSPDLARIFEAFERGRDSEESGIRGTGIGLAIVRETVHSLGGSASVQHASPGARFIMEWPHAAADH